MPIETVPGVDIQVPQVGVQLVHPPPCELALLERVQQQAAKHVAGGSFLRSCIDVREQQLSMEQVGDVHTVHVPQD